MICQDCKNGYHEGCRRGTWCDCAHRGSGPTWHEVTSHEELMALMETMKEEVNEAQNTDR